MKYAFIMPCMIAPILTAQLKPYQLSSFDEHAVPANN